MKVKDSIKAPVIRFQDKLTSAGSWMILRLPKTASSKLPSRGLVMVEGKFNGAGFKTALEPDGKGSHWFKIDDSIPKVGGLKIGSKVTVEIRPVKEWPEPKIPADLKKALAESPQAYKTWKDITPMARWDWIRWIRSTKNMNSDIDIRTYAKYILREGSIVEKRELLGCLKSQVILTDKIIKLVD